MNKLSKAVLVALGLVTLASCGGGDGGIAAGGTGGTGISQGPITGFGSVFVNGVKIEDTAATRIEVEDNATGTARTDLKVGMVVKVEWERDAAGTLTAKNIVYGDDVQGPTGVVTVTGTDSTFTVLGQTVMTHAASTVFAGVADAAALAAMPTTTVVEVSGLRDGTGVIHATRIEVKTGATEFELKGVVSVASVGDTFTLGTTPAIVVINSPITVAVGACVEVKSITGMSSGQLVASAVETDDDCTLGGAEGNELEVKGFPSAINTTNNTLTVNGQSISYPDTAFVLGKSETDLSSSVIVEVEGSLSGGVLVAKKISFEIEGANEAKGSAGGSITADGTFTVTVAESTPSISGSQTFTVNNLTSYEDDSASPIANFGRANVASGQTLKVYYYLDGATKIATRIKRQ